MCFLTNVFTKTYLPGMDTVLYQKLIQKNVYDDFLGNISPELFY